MSQQDLNVRLTATDQTAQATTSAERNLERVQQKANQAAQAVQRAVSPAQAGSGGVGYYTPGVVPPAIGGTGAGGVGYSTGYYGWAGGIAPALGGMIGAQIGSGQAARVGNNIAELSRAARPESFLRTSGTPISQIGQAVNAGVGSTARSASGGWLRGAGSMLGSAAGLAANAIPGGRFLKTALAVGAGIAVEKLSEGAVSSIEEQIAEWSKVGAAYKDLVNAIKTTGKYSFEITQSARESAHKMAWKYNMPLTETFSNVSLVSKMTGFTGGELESGFEAAVGLGKQYNLDMETSARLIGKAKVGNFETLSRYGIDVGHGTDAEKYQRLMGIGHSRAEAYVKQRPNWKNWLHENIWEPFEIRGVNAMAWWDDQYLPNDRRLTRNPNYNYFQNAWAVGDKVQAGIRQGWQTMRNFGVGLINLPSTIAGGISGAQGEVSERMWQTTELGQGMMELGQRQFKSLWAYATRKDPTGLAKFLADEQQIKYMLEAPLMTPEKRQLKLLHSNLEKSRGRPTEKAAQAELDQFLLERSGERASQFARINLGGSALDLRQREIEAEQIREKYPREYQARMAELGRYRQSLKDRFSISPIASQMRELGFELQAAVRGEDPAWAAGVRRAMRSTRRGAEMDLLQQQLAILQANAVPMQTLAPNIESRFLRYTPNEANPLTMIAANQAEMNAIGRQILNLQNQNLPDIKEALKALKVADDGVK